MAMKSLPPGFRFHPTDDELVLYYLKRKIMGKKFHFEAIVEVNIYRFSPWDLPEQSCLKSKDLEWYFFCPIEKKYASGARFKRATESGFWKITGNDRPIRSNLKTVGTVKTLVFYSGHATQWERTDWVMHEYRILPDQLAEARVQETYVLCKVFKKNGPGPKNGVHYGAPFNEEDWADDDISDDQTHETALAFDGPPTMLTPSEKQACAPVTDLIFSGSTSGLPLTEGLSPGGCSTSEVFLDETDDEIIRLLALFTNEDDAGDAQTLVTPLAPNGASPTPLTLLGKRAGPHVTGSIFYGSMSGLPLEDCPSPLAGHSTSEGFINETDDEITRLLASFTNDDTLLLDKSGINLGNLNDKMETKSLPCSDVYVKHSGMADLDSWVQTNEERFDFSAMQKDSYSMNMFQQDGLAYMELNNHLVSFCYSDEVNVTDQSIVDEIFGLYNNGNVQQLHSGVCFADMDQYAASENRLLVPPEEAYNGDNCFGRTSDGQQPVLPGL